jgi:hypothetical protein
LKAYWLMWTLQQGWVTQKERKKIKAEKDDMGPDQCRAGM